MTIGKGGIIAAGALVLASGAIGYRLTIGDGAPAEKAVAADPFAILEQATRDSPDDAGAWQRLGVAYYDAGRFADAANAYGRASEADPKNAALWSSLGEALVMGSERESMPAPAREAFAKAIATRAITAWEGVGDETGAPLTVSPEGIAALLDLWPMFERFQTEVFDDGWDTVDEEPPPLHTTASTGLKLSMRALAPGRGDWSGA